MRRLLLAALLAVAFAATADAGNYQPPPGDYGAQWVTNATLLCNCWSPAAVAYGWTLVGLDGSATPLGVPRDARVLAGGAGPLLAVGSDSSLFTVAPDGSGRRVLAPAGDPLAWIDHGTRLVYGVGKRLFSVGADGSAPLAYPAKVQGVPSPDGSRFAYAKETADYSNSFVHVVNADGSGDHRIGVGYSRPAWSPDGTHLAWWGTGASLAVSTADGKKQLFFTIAGAVTNGSVAWGPDSRRVYGMGALGLVGIDILTGTWHVLTGVSWLLSTPAFSPDGERVAYSTGGECRDRIGIYVANSDGSSRRRITNNCAITGTDGPDVLHGDFSQIVLGLGGDDTLYADDSYYFFDGISLYGGPGDDKLYGGYARDSLYGGPGDDLLDGGPSKDLLIGGPGHDHISGGSGNDLIGVQDGERDWISCGTNLPSDGIPDHDVVYADKVDVVAKDCEVVHRR